jgi:hypothetical protein
MAVVPGAAGPCSETPATVIASHQLFCFNVFSMTSPGVPFPGPNMPPSPGFFYPADLKRFIRESGKIDIGALYGRSTTAMKSVFARRGPRPVRIP